jgi:hypothetical protein
MVAAGFIGLTAGPSFAQTGKAMAGKNMMAKDPVLGTWVLNRAKSTFSNNDPFTRTVTYEMTEDGSLKVVTLTRMPRGETDRVEYMVKEDGKDYPISNSVLNYISLKRIDDLTVERIGKVQGQVVETRRRTVSPDGKMLTIVTNGTNRGVSYTSTQVFERAADQMTDR